MRKNIKKMAAIGISGLLSAGLLVGSVDYASHMFSMNNEVVAKEVEKVTNTIKNNAAERNSIIRLSAFLLKNVKIWNKMNEYSCWNEK